MTARLSILITGATIMVLCIAVFVQGCAIRTMNSTDRLQNRQLTCLLERPADPRTCRRP